MTLLADSQVHLWVKSRPITSANAHHRQAPVFSKDDLLGEMDAAGVERVVIVPPSWEDNEHALLAARLHPGRFAVMGRIAHDRPNPEALECWRKQQGMMGLRLVFNAEHRSFLLEGAADWIWPAAERAGLPVMVLAPGLLPRIKEVAEKHPRLRLVIDHMGAMRHAKGKDAFAHLPDLLALARFPNVAVKASGLPGYAAEPYPFLDVHEPLRRTIDAFGADRVFWGTDLSRMPCSYRACVTAFTEEFEWKSGAERDRVMGTALCDWIDWPRPNGPAN